MTVTAALHRAVQTSPSKVATRFRGRDQTFAQLAGRVARLAGALQAQGLRRGETVAILALNGDRYLECCLAVSWAGAVLSPCNTRWSAAELAFSLDDARAAVLLVDDTYTELGMAVARMAGTVRRVIHMGEQPAPAGLLSYEGLIAQAAPVDDARMRPDETAGIFYTGGTTGFPKGVVLTHQNIWASSMCYLLEGMCPVGATYLHAAPMFHLADFGLSMASLIRGATHAFVPSFEPAAVIQSLVRDGVTDVLLVPTMIQMLVDHPDMRAARDAITLRRLIFGASPMSETLLQRTMDAIPGVQFAQGYGMTEMSPLVSFNPFENHAPGGMARGKLASVGRPTFAVEVRIVDGTGAEVPRGTVGEIIARGPSVMQGYLNKPQETAAAIRNGWMHTGDGGTMDEDGYLYLADRLKDMIISGGENVYSVEVENVVARHPAVASVAVIGIPSERWGESVHACVVLKPGQRATAEDIQAFCKQQIAGYKCPRSVQFCEALPLSAAGKILKHQLRKPFWNAEIVAKT